MKPVSDYPQVWQPAISRLQSETMVDPNTECWEFTGCHAPNGYGMVTMIRAYGYKGSVHRLSYLIHHGVIPPGKSVCHRCDNPPCWNPDHLYAGSSKENSADMVAKGRSARGEHAARARLTEAEVRHIRDLYAAGNGISGTARAVGRPIPTVANIVYRRVWRHLP